MIYSKHWKIQLFTRLIFLLNSPANLELALLVLRFAELFSRKIIACENAGSSSVSSIYKKLAKAVWWECQCGDGHRLILQVEQERGKGVIIVRMLGIWFLLASVITMVIDATQSLAANQLVITSLGKQWYDFHPQSLATFQKAVETNLHPFVWDPVLTAILLWPSWALFGLLGIILLWVGRRRHHTRIYTNF